MHRWSLTALLAIGFGFGCDAALATTSPPAYYGGQLPATATIPTGQVTGLTYKNTYDLVRDEGAKCDDFHGRHDGDLKLAQPDGSRGQADGTGGHLPIYTPTLSALCVQLFGYR